MTKNENILFWCAILLILLIGMLCGALLMHQYQKPIANQTYKLEYRTYNRDDLRVHLTIRNDTLLHFEYSKKYNP